MEGFKDPRIAVSVSAKTPHVLTCIGLMISLWLGLSYFIRYGGRGGLKLKVLKGTSRLRLQGPNLALLENEVVCPGVWSLSFSPAKRASYSKATSYDFIY